MNLENNFLLLTIFLPFYCGDPTIKSIFSTVFWGISGAGMAILTPNTVYGFPSVDYLANQYGHTLILLAISTAIIVLISGLM